MDRDSSCRDCSSEWNRSSDHSSSDTDVSALFIEMFFYPAPVTAAAVAVERRDSWEHRSIVLLRHRLSSSMDLS